MNQITEYTDSVHADTPIHIVDDDPAVRDALSVVFELEGFDVLAHESGETFIASLHDRPPACVLLDVHMPGRSGIDILQALQESDYEAPVFIISGQGDIPMAVSAIQRGAVDFIEKPFDVDTLLHKVTTALEKQPAIARQSQSGFDGKELLTPREREVLEQIASGASNKEAGLKLKISPRTVEVHRARIMDKLGARNAADLVRIVFSGGDTSS